MNSPIVGLRVAAVIFGLACLGQLTRLLAQLEVMIAGRHIPVWWSAIAVLVLAALCAWLWRLSLPAKAPESQPTPPHQPTPAAS